MNENVNKTEKQNGNKLTKIEGIIKSVNFFDTPGKKKWLKVELVGSYNDVKFIIAWEEMAKNCNSWFHENDHIKLTGTKEYDESFLKGWKVTVRSDSEIIINSKIVYTGSEDLERSDIDASLETALSKLNQEEHDIIDALPIKFANNKSNKQRDTELDTADPAPSSMKTKKGKSKVKTKTKAKSKLSKDVNSELTSMKKTYEFNENSTTPLITKEIVKEQINSFASDKEIFFFLELCKAYNLNPFLDIYLIKYNNTSKAQFVVSKDYFLKKSKQHKDFLEFEAGIIVREENNSYERLEGSMYDTDRQKLIGGYCVVRFKKESEKSTFNHTVSLHEYDTNQSTWKKIPATMIRKVAIVQALRESFPEIFSQLYDSSELGV